ncbi:MAG: ribosome maturation factor RimP [Xanthomonadaceae bacterium]|nr:ribosome maturation factor RimP [Xanthomonadaceae bacterium]
MNDKANEIAELLAPTVQAVGLDLLGIEYLPGASGALLRLYIDVPEAERGERAVSIEDCETVSHEVSAQLDVADPITGHYTLEVSSPGVDRPLFTLAQFSAFIGFQVRVTLQLPREGRRRFQGVILRVEKAAIVLRADGQDVELAFDNIEKARLVPDWEALGMAPKPKPGSKAAGSGKH